jgi:hypothetical protein
MPVLDTETKAHGAPQSGEGARRALFGTGYGTHGADRAPTGIVKKSNQSSGTDGPETRSQTRFFAIGFVSVNRPGFGGLVVQADGLAEKFFRGIGVAGFHGFEETALDRVQSRFDHPIVHALAGITSQSFTGRLRIWHDYPLVPPHQGGMSWRLLFRSYWVEKCLLKTVTLSRKREKVK